MKLFTRMNFTIALLVLQTVLLAVFAFWVMQTHDFLRWTGIFFSVLVFSFVLKKDEASVYKITWLIIILAFPSVGGVFYLLFGNKRPVRKIAAHMREHALIAKLLDADGNLPFVNRITCGRMFSLLNYIRNASSYHAYEHTETTYYSMGEDMFADMLAEIAAAERFIFLEFFIIKDGVMWRRLLAALEERAAAGVTVRLIVDHLGSHKLFTRSYLKKLRAKGFGVLRFNPLVPFLLLFMNNRDHRKVLVVDGKAAFTGGINIADEYINEIRRFGVWKDSGLRLRGDAVWSFTLMFIEMWDTFCKKDERIEHREPRQARTESREQESAATRSLEAEKCVGHREQESATTRSLEAEKCVVADFRRQNPASGECVNDDSCSRRIGASPPAWRGSGFVVPYGDSPLDNEQLSENILTDILAQAERYVYFFTPYFIISERLISALQLAAKRGVDVRIVTPGIPDKRLVYRLTRSYYRYMHDAGVKIFEYTPGFLHSKSVVCDDKIAVVGTVNLDYRSLYLHFECAVLLYNSDAVADVYNDAIRTMEVSRQVSATPANRRLGAELLDAVLHLFAPLM
ncbi:MAG: phospholipase D-like domain-containing protein [Defluviitaleaceae bacterium]|nr:phospholipase D-like domain-containing protein [Defluviitaleaceae bacterium]